jgi:hypothetical protein
MRAYQVAAIAALALLAGCATPVPRFRELGSDSYEITRRSESLSVRSGELKVRAELEALAYCKDRDRALAMLDSRTADPDPPEYAYATVRFRCVPR